MTPASLPEIHPAALLFPMMAEDELAKLADDIAANGLLEPIIIFQGQVLDGRNRLAACDLADVQPQFIEVSPESVPSPVLYVLSRNLHRRHLSVSQRAAVAAEVAILLQEESRKTSVANLKNQPSRPNGHIEGETREIAANELQVGGRTVQRAISVKRTAPEVFERVKRGELTVGEAARKELEPQPHGAETPYEPKTDRQKQLAEGQKERMVRALSQITGLCRGLAEMDVRKALSACDTEELATWTERAKDLSSQLRAFAARLQKGK